MGTNVERSWLAVGLTQAEAATRRALRSEGWADVSGESLPGTDQGSGAGLWIFLYNPLLAVILVLLLAIPVIGPMIGRSLGPAIPPPDEGDNDIELFGLLEGRWSHEIVRISLRSVGPTRTEVTITGYQARMMERFRRSIQVLAGSPSDCPSRVRRRRVSSPL